MSNVLSQVPIRVGVNTFTYLGTQTGPISTYNAFLDPIRGVISGDVNGGAPDFYSPSNPSFANDINTFTQNRSYVIFATQNFNLGLSGTYVPAQPAKFNMVPGFNTFGFDYNCVRQTLSTFRGKGLFTVITRNPNPGAGDDQLIYIDAFAVNNRPQQFGLDYLEPLSSYWCNATGNITLTAERIFNLLITEDNRFIITNPPVSGIRV